MTATPRDDRWRWLIVALGVAALLVGLAMLRPIDHDESQYVAAALLSARGLPYRDFAYLQTPLQPMLLAPLAVLAGGWTCPVLRAVNALFGAVMLAACFGAARAGGADARRAGLAIGLMACCDIFLFTSAVARNDALPAALLALALWLIVRQAQDRGGAGSALATGFLLASAAAAKISFALPAVAYGAYALVDRRHRPALLLAGAAPVALAMLWIYAQAPDAFIFGVFTFPAKAPAEWYLAQQMPWKLSLTGKALDTIKFLALGPALMALVIAARFPGSARIERLLDLMIAAGLVAALLPEPTWRQYLLPVLPPLFVRLALVWQRVPPGRGARIAAVIFAIGGLAPSVEAIIKATRGVPMAVALDQGRALGASFRAAGGKGPVATLSPQLLPAAGLEIDPRFAAGPFYFRSLALLDAADERRFHLVSRNRLDAAAPLSAILVGGEGAWTAGEASDDAPLIAYARARGWRRIDIPGGRLTLYLRPRQAATR
ncbi:glycosyltransferase family 39 protein [Sphingomonas sp. CCH10-B3]|uniref:glycosyltransferase family 39 protein n=1 Tax=Sphingomonas sp. CCH10-B3 TaxID=1768757 RepID=UPI00082DEB7A|nr:glycosyltransferase family 39 protein [Sphingomonas sp. CCH10-B3]